MTLPTLTVALDDGTGTFPYNITSRVMATEGYSISRGRSDWQGAVTAGELTLTLNNSDGYFTDASPLVFVDQKIKLTETVNAVVYTRFTGYVKSWPVSWPAVVVTVSMVSPTATDAQARAERTTLRSMLEEEVLLRSPSAYYTLGEAEGSTTAGDTSGNQAPPVTATGTGTAVAFGTGTGPVDGLSAAQFASGQYLARSTGQVIASPLTFAIGIVFATTTVGSPDLLFVDGWRLLINGAGQVFATAAGTGGIASVTTYNDGLTHSAIITGDGATATLVVDGVVKATAAIVAGDAAEKTEIGGPTFTGTLSHAVEWPSLSVADAQAITAFAGGNTESGTARLTRLASYADIPVGTLDTSLTNVPIQVTSEVGAFTAIQDVADAEGGVVFINGSGNLTFHNRDRPSAKTTPDLTLSSQYVTPEVQPVIDDQQLVNYFQATSTQTGSAQLARNLTSEDTHGRYPDSRSYLVLTDQEALDRANWAVGKLATPVTRYGTLTINLYGMTASQASTVLAALDINCWLRVTSLASQTPDGTTADVVVEGWQAQVTAESWTITCNVVARALFQAWILGSTTYSVLGSTTILGL